MENASKALIIAGGVLLAMIVISLFYAVFRGMGEAAGSASQDSAQKELSAFNTAYEAYDKKVMYGMDIVSVLNMAISNNKQYGIEYYDENNEFVDFYVNVIFTFNGNTLSLKNNYQKIQEDVLDILKIPASTRIKKSTGNPAINPDYDPKCDAFVNNLQQKDYKCAKVSYNDRSNIKYNIGAIGRVREMIFEPRS